VDGGVETAEPVDLRRHFLGAGNGLQIAGDHLLGARQCPPRIVRALAIARMEDHPMPLLDECCPAIRPSPVDEPEMKTRAMDYS